MLDVLSKYTGVKTYDNYEKLLATEELDCVFVATPSTYHNAIVRTALQRNLHVFCEKPFALDPAAGLELAELAESRKLINQVGYHYRFVAAFSEAKRLIDARAIGDLHHVRAEAYGPVVLRPSGATWRSKKSEGGGCLYDYACHAIDLVNFVVGRPTAVSGTVLNSVFSSDVDDEIYSTFQFGERCHGQLATNWSDESFRKMSVKLSLWGSNGRINVDRQEITADSVTAIFEHAFNENLSVRNLTRYQEVSQFLIVDPPPEEPAGEFPLTLDLRRSPGR